MKKLTGKKILVVDDEELLREILMEDLADNGAEVTGAENGTRAFELIKSQNFDAVITDARMPGGSGVGLINNMNEYYKENRPPVFICSGYNDITRSEIESMKVSHAFNKPFDRDEFIKVISTNLAQKIT